MEELEPPDDVTLARLFEALLGPAQRHGVVFEIEELIYQPFPTPGEALPNGPLGEAPPAHRKSDFYGPSPAAAAERQARKETPVATGVLNYFPNAIEQVAQVSFVGNQQHNPGQPMHWAREKSKDEADALARHLLDFLRGAEYDSDGLPHLAKVAWRALALLQRWCDCEYVRGYHS